MSSILVTRPPHYELRYKSRTSEGVMTADLDEPFALLAKIELLMRNKEDLDIQIIRRNTYAKEATQ